jgi:nucleoid DNA-binding protein
LLEPQNSQRKSPERFVEIVFETSLRPSIKGENRNCVVLVSFECVKPAPGEAETRRPGDPVSIPANAYPISKPGKELKELINR